MRRYGDQEVTIDQMYLAELVEATEDQTRAIREQTQALTEVLKYLTPFADSRAPEASDSSSEAIDGDQVEPEPFDWPRCPRCGCPLNECHRDGCCALKP